MSWENILKTKQRRLKNLGAYYGFYDGIVGEKTNLDTHKAIRLYWTNKNEYKINDRFREYKEREGINLPQKVSKQTLQEITLDALKEFHRELPSEEKFDWSKVSYGQLFAATVMVTYEGYLR